MVIQSEKNLYPGVNAHLNSFLQQDGGGWEMFHARHLNYLTTEISAHLPKNYYVTLEKSHQVHLINLDEARLTRPDVGIRQMRPSAQSISPTLELTEPSLTTPLEMMLQDVDDYLIAPVIYELVDQQYPGIPVTRIELLSPSNKPPHTSYYHYLVKRRETLKGGLNLIELDYLHESRPILPSLASYRDEDEAVEPYMVIVSSPQPSLKDGMMYVYRFGVDAPLPKIFIPLAHDDGIGLDLTKVYHETFASLPIFSIVVDYAQEPVNFDKYSEADRTRIRQIMSDIPANNPPET